MHTIDITEPLVHGRVDLERTAQGVRIHRLPAWLRRLWPEPRLMAMEQQAAGVRLVLDTDARALELTMRSAHAAPKAISPITPETNRPMIPPSAPLPASGSSQKTSAKQST